MRFNILFLVAAVSAIEYGHNSNRCKAFCESAYGPSYRSASNINKCIKQSILNSGLCYDCGPMKRRSIDVCRYGVLGAMCCDRDKPNCCNNQCVDKKSDAKNCGQCGKNCASGAPTCCNNRCINTKSDPNNCGECGKKCTGGLSTCCDGQCVDTKSDPKNCGVCGNECAEGASTCENGQCGCPTPSVGTDCDETCKCGDGLMCVSGKCCIDVCFASGSQFWQNSIRASGTVGRPIDSVTPRDCCQLCYNNPTCKQWTLPNVGFCMHYMASNVCDTPTSLMFVSSGGRCDGEIDNQCLTSTVSMNRMTTSNRMSRSSRMSRIQ